MLFGRFPGRESAIPVAHFQYQEGILLVLLNRFLKDERGATAIEYGLIAAGIALAIIAVVNGLGTTLNTKFTSLNTSLK